MYGRRRKGSKLKHALHASRSYASMLGQLGSYGGSHEAVALIPTYATESGSEEQVWRSETY